MSKRVIKQTIGFMLLFWIFVFAPVSLAVSNDPIGKLIGGAFLGLELAVLLFVALVWLFNGES